MAFDNAELEEDMASKLSILNCNPKRLPGPSLLHELVATNAHQHAVAIDYTSSDGIADQVTYADLHERSNRLANRLRSVWRATSTTEHTKFIVPLLIPQSPDLYIAQIATLKAGAAFCPISLDVPEERLRFILQDVDARILLTTSMLQSTLPALDNVAVISADDDNEASKDDCGGVAIDAASPAYIMYTSGSTGQPKGVVLSHSAATQALLAHDVHIPAFSRFLQFASPTFDVSVFEIFFPFFRGCTLVCGDRRQLLSDLPGFINRMDIDAAELTPSVASSLLQGRASVPGLKTLLTIGEMLKHDVVEDFGESAEASSILHGMYGPTEATIHCTLQSSFHEDMSVGNIGIPLDTVSAFVVKPLETDGPTISEPEIVPLGEEGELAVGGYQLADGYLNRREQTDAAFVSHPVYGRIYRTGDRAKMTPEGRLECLGRISSGQVKLRGQRIELGEIEHAASKTPGCRSVVAEVVSGTLVAFLIGDASQLIRSKVSATCQKWLPAFMVPGDVMILNELPYLASGKVDRKALHQMYSKRATEEDPNEEQVSDSLRSILDTIESALNTSVHPETQLATVGLDSLSAISIASRLRNGGFPNLDATALLDARTPRDIEQLSMDLPAGSSDDSTPVEDIEGDSDFYHFAMELEMFRTLADEVDRIFPSTSVQAAMLSETARDSRAYCNWIELAIPAVHAIKSIRSCLVELARQHLLLRSGFLAIPNSIYSHAVVVWKDILPTQIQEVDKFKYDFDIDNERNLLRPCSFEMMRARSETRLLLRIHHALYDQWSIDVLKADLGSMLNGRPMEQTPTFDRVSAFHHQMNTQARSQASVEFWQDQLREFSPTLLPLMNKKRASPLLERTNWQALDHDMNDLRSAAQEMACSVPAVFQAAMAYILGSYVGSNDVTYGTVFSGRHLPIPDIERMFGPCLSTLPVRLDYGATRNVRDILHLVHDRNRSIQKHCLLPVSQIKSVAGLTPETKLFDILFVWQDTSIGSQIEDSPVREVASADHHEFNLVIEFEPSKEGLRAKATYRQSLITAEQVAIMLQQTSTLAGAMLKNAEALVEDLPKFLPDNALSIVNPKPSPSASGHDLVRTIERHAVTAPQSPALIFTNQGDQANVQTLSFLELNSKSNLMANYLTTLKHHPHELVCICMEKSIDLYVAILATLKAGCGYLPLLPDTPPARIASILTQSSARLSLCDASSAQVMRDIQATTVVNVNSIDLDSIPADNLPSSISGSEIAYTVFTSGSTGEPKGVAVTAENLLGNLQALSDLYQVQSGDKLLQACSQAFDVSVFEIFFSFYSGICLYSAPKDVLFEDIEANIRSFGITHLSLTPTVAALVDPKNVPSVKFLVTAGEAVTELVHDRWAGQGLHQGYGPSETTNICSINMNVQHDDVLGNIGPPFSNTSAVVLAPGAGFRILPAGAVGELAFGGEQVFKGYVGMEALNAEKIIDHTELGRVYKSGDVGRILPDGTLLISGRLDDQVKIRGNRIELGEINAALLRSSLVHDCNTVLTGETAADEDLVTFVMLRSTSGSHSETLDVVFPGSDVIERLFRQLEDALPSYMIPSMVITVNQLPLTTQGKLDRRTLKRYLAALDNDSRSRFSRSSEMPQDDGDWSQTERQIASTLANGLSIPLSSVSPHAAFFGLGLNSLNAISFAKHLTRSLGVPVGPGNVLRNPSVSRLARSLESQAPGSPRDDSSHAEPLLSENTTADVRRKLECEDIEEVLPCTPLQEAMISASSFSGSSYCNTTWIQVVGDLDTLRNCWQEMLERHTILRTRFIETQSPDHPVVQVVTKDFRLPWMMERLDNLANIDAHLQSSDQRKVGPLQPFSIEAYVSPESIKLALHMHHAIYDGISIVRLLDEVESRYRGEILPPPVSFSDFLRKTSDQRSASTFEFWKPRLEDLLPAPFPQSKDKSRDGEHAVQVALGSQQARIDKYCKRYGVTPLSVFQAAVVKVLSQMQSTTDVCIGNVVSGRSVSVDRVERLVAPCFNTIPVRARLERMRSNMDLIRSLAQTNTDSVDYHLSPLRRLQGLSADPSKRLFDTLLLLQPPHAPLDNTVWNLEREVGSMGLPLVLEISPENDGFTLTVHHLEAFVSSELARRFSQAFTASVEGCMEYPFSDLFSSDRDIDYTIRGVLVPDEKAKASNGDANGHEGEDESVWTDEEKAVRDVAARLAKVPSKRILKDTSMYQLGLDSLNAPQVAAQLRSRGYRVDAADVIEALTPRSIANLLQSAAEHSEASITIDFEDFDSKHRAEIIREMRINDTDVLKIRPCSSVQSGMIAQSLQAKGSLYINHVTYQLPKGVSAEELRSAWKAVMQKHEMLRTGFHNLHESETPFALVVMRSHVSEAPLLTKVDHSSPVALEEQARDDIVHRLGSPPWRVTPSSGGRMRMMVSMHHALYDAESLQIILNDLQRALRSYYIGQTLDIDSLLSSIISSERQSLASTATESFWAEQFEGFGFVKFPDLSPTIAPDSRLGAEECKCNLSLADIEEFCRGNSATIQALGQTTWALLLSAYTGESAVTFGTVFSGRTSSSAWQTVFPSVSTIPVPCNAAAAPLEILKAMVDYNAAAQRHRSTPLADIQRFTDHAGRPLFDTVFVYQKTATSVSTVDWPVIRESAAVDYTASLELQVDDQMGVQIRLTFDTARIPSFQARIMIQQYSKALEDFVLGHDSDFGQAPALFSALTPKVPEIPSEARLLHEFVQQGARSHPSRVAFEFVTGFNGQNKVISSWTYLELDRISNQIAHAVLQAGARPGTAIALCMDKCPEATFAFVGILKAGCSFLALDPDLPQDRITFILQDSGASALLTAGTARTVAAPEHVSMLSIDIKGVARFHHTLPKVPHVSPSDTCYVLYTSGTTGAPKGCEITHENAVQAMLAFQRLFSGHWTQKSRWLQFASYWFDVSVLEQFWSWSVGVSVIGAPRDIVLEDISGFIRRLNITHIDLTPSLARLVRPEDVPSLCGGVFITGGEALKQEIIDAWGGRKTICNGYGPTEATIGVTMNTFIGSDAKPSNIGRAFDNVGSYVLSPDTCKPVIRGAVGELCVSGKLVGKGYLNRPDLTAKQFPYVAELGERIYRTGDLVRLLHDGSFQFLGRKDTQAKLRGQRLEIGEIDTIIRGSTEDIADVVSLVLKNNHSKETLVSFLTLVQRAESERPEANLSDNARKAVGKAQSACEQKLPGYMVPTHIVPLSVLPLTVNNKIDSKRLSTVFESIDNKTLESLKRRDGSARPLNASERSICEALREMFAVDTKHTQSSTNLFSLGLSSISAISFASVLKRAGFLRANVATIMRNQTIGQLATALVDEPSHRSGDDNVEQSKLAIRAYAQRYRGLVAKALNLRLEEIEAVAPCTPLQQGLILESMRDESRPYFNWFTYKLHDVDPKRLERVCRSFLNTVQVLRSSFIGLDEGYGQVVRKQSHAPVQTWSVASEYLDVALRTKRHDWANKNSSDLVTPVEIHIVESPGQSFLVVHIHHALYDGISFELLMDLLWQHYFSSHEPVVGPSFIDALPYGPLKHLTGSQDFWKRRLQGYSYVALPAAASDVNSSLSLRCHFPKSGATEEQRQKLGVSHQAMAQAAFEIALRQFRGTDQTQTYGIVVSGRSIELDGGYKVLGPMFNTLPQPITAQSPSTLSKHIRHCHEMNAEALPHQHTSLRDIRKWTGAHPSDPMFDVLFVFQHATAADKEQTHRPCTLIGGQAQAEYPLACQAELLDDGQLDLTLLAQSKFFNEEDLEQLMAKIQSAFECMITSPDAHLGEAFGLKQFAQATDGSESDRALPHINGVHHFEWSAEAITIRDIISQLACVNTQDMDEHSSIFSLGLDSIDAVKLASRLRNKGLALPVSEILRAQTIPRMLDGLKNQRVTVNSTGPSRIDKMTASLERSLTGSLDSSVSVERILPATPSQEALVADMIRSDFDEYFNHDILHLDRKVEIRRLKSAWQTVIDASPILRTAFVQVTDPSVEAVFGQVVHSASSIEIPELRFESLPKIDQYLKAIMNDVSTSPVQRPPLRLTLALVGDERYLILSLPHALYDGHSLALLHDDVQCAYAGSFKSRPSYDGAIEAALSAVGEDARQFWTDTLSGARPKGFPKTGRSIGDHVVYRAEIESKRSAETVRSFCQRQGVSMQALAQTCWGLTLAHYTQALEVLFGAVLACRDSEEAEDIIFPMMNTVVMRSALHGSRSDMLQYMQSAISEMLPYQRTPLRTIQKACSGVLEHGDPTLDGALFDTLFIYQHRPESSTAPAEALYESVGGNSNVDYSVAVEMEVVDGKIAVRVACKADVLDEQGAQDLIRMVDDILCRIVDEPDRPTVDLKQGSVSVCGLEAFNHRSLEPHGSRIRDRAAIKAAAEHASPAIVEAIVDVFAQISDVSAADLDGSSTIESIGIDSISAIKVVSLLRKKDINLSVSDIVKAKSADRIAELLSKRSVAPTETADAPGQIVQEAMKTVTLDDVAFTAGVDSAEVETVLPATAGQVYMASLWMKTGGQIFYPTFTYRLQADVGEAEIMRAWGGLVEKHPILRTVFVASKDKSMPALQLVLKNGTGPKSPKHQLLISLELRRVDCVYELDLKIHHALYDAVSLPLLIADLEHLLAGKKPAQPKVKQKDLLAVSITLEARSRQKAFWTSYLQNVTPIKLSQPALDGPQSKVEIFKLDLFDRTTQLDAVAREESLSIQALLFAAYAKVYTGFPARTGSVATDVVLGIYLSNRSHLPELESLAAPTLNLVPLVVRSPKTRNLLQVAQEIQKDLREISTPENSATGLWEINEWTGVKVDTFVNFLKLPEKSERDGDDCDVRIEEVSERRVKERREVVAAEERSEFEMPAGLREMGVVDAYQHSVDIEMMVTDGKLGVGLFAPVEMVSLEEAGGALAELKEALEELVGDTKE